MGQFSVLTKKQSSDENVNSASNHGAIDLYGIIESEHQKGKVIPLCKLFKGRVTHLFQNFLMRMDKLPKETGRILPKGDWKSEYYRLLDLESTQVHDWTSFQMLLLGWFSCSLCAVYVASEFGSVNSSRVLMDLMRISKEY